MLSTLQQQKKGEVRHFHDKERGERPLLSDTEKGALLLLAYLPLQKERELLQPLLSSMELKLNFSQQRLTNGEIISQQLKKEVVSLYTETHAQSRSDSRTHRQRQRHNREKAQCMRGAQTQTQVG